MIKQLKQAIHSYVSIPCFMTLLLFYICHITTLLPYFKVWEIHVALLPFISNQVRNKQNMRMLHMYVSVTMAWWHRWCICLWNDMQFSESQTPRVLHLELQDYLSRVTRDESDEYCYNVHLIFFHVVEIHLPTRVCRQFGRITGYPPPLYSTNQELHGCVID